jgi:hypothetical protein
MRYDGTGEYDSTPPAFYDSTDSSPSRKRKVKVKNPVPELPESQRVPTSQNIHDHLVGNAAFTTPSPTLMVFQTHIDDAAAAIIASAAAVTAARMAVQAKRLALEVLNSDTALLAAYVDNASAGDEDKILSSGFLVRATPTPPVAPSAPLLLDINPGAFQGQLLGRFQPVTNVIVRLYEFQTTLDPNAEPSWVTRGTSTRASFEINDLASGDYCWVRVRAIGTAAQARRARRRPRRCRERTVKSDQKFGYVEGDGVTK